MDIKNKKRFWELSFQKFSFPFKGIRRFHRLKNKIFRSFLIMTSISSNGIVRLCFTHQMRRRIMQSVLTLIPRLTDRQVLKETPIYVVGDILGQYVHLLRIFNEFGHPPGKRYLFLGNYATQNPLGIETLALLFAYKLLYPQSIYLLRGRRECPTIGRLYGQYDQCVKRFSRRLWHEISTVFTYLPVAAIIEDQILCVHSGLSPSIQYADLTSVNELRGQFLRLITRPNEIQPHALTTHLIWSEPDEGTTGWDQNPAGLGYLFGPDVVKAVCDRLDLLQIVRSSGLVRKGCARFADTKLVSVFSAPDLEDTYENDGAVLHFSSKRTTRMNVKFEDVAFDMLLTDKKMEQKYCPRIKNRNNGICITILIVMLNNQTHQKIWTELCEIH
ncbi:unnamed protein product [Echinostoma caproni]|uniref:protein-serine/threonine phosphatase n=1 Tax=Echinostoma caproni TaxID=27848 RepID=A0A3P8KCT9_9TREM|nr:unnamed protein product [Echinostoma caproni]